MSKQQNVKKIGKKPRVQVLYGDPEIAIEKAENIIVFPGGHVAVMRTSDNEYWVHIGVTTPEKCIPADQSQFETMGAVKKIRIDKDFDGNPFHMAALVSTGKPHRQADYTDLEALARRYKEIAGNAGQQIELFEEQKQD